MPLSIIVLTVMPDTVHNLSRVHSNSVVTVELPQFLYYTKETVPNLAMTA